MLGPAGASGEQRDQGLALEEFPASLGTPTNPKSQLSLWGAYNQQLPLQSPGSLSAKLLSESPYLKPG